jgi:hypothetical protein
MRVDARLQIVYLVAVAVLAFATSDPVWLVGLLLLQLGLWLALGLPLPPLLGIVRKLSVFFLFIAISYVFFAPEPGDRLLPLAVGGLVVELNITGLVRGLLLSSRIVTVICASQIIQRAGDGTAIVTGLRGLFVPATIAYSLDLVLALLGASEPGRPVGAGRGMGGGGGTGGGTGGGRRRAAEPSGDPVAEESGWRSVRRVLKGDVGFLVDLAHRNIARARERAEGYGLKPEALADLAVITGLAVVAMSIRALHTLPGIPFAPGHKGVITLPLYIVAHELTSARSGATRLGVVIGITSFLTGEGKFGVFEILRHITPGLFVDLVMPLTRLGGREPGPLVYALVGLGAAMTRLSTLLAVAYFVTAPKVFYAFLIPTLVSNTLFGTLSGFVTYHVMRSVQKLRAAL